MNGLLPALVDLVIVLTLLEAGALVAWRRWNGGGVAWRDFAVNMAAGLFLMLALHGAVRGAGAEWVLPCLLAAGVAHGIDLRARWRPTARAPRRLPGAFP